MIAKPTLVLFLVACSSPAPQYFCTFTNSDGVQVTRRTNSCQDTCQELDNSKLVSGKCEVVQ